MNRIPPSPETRRLKWVRTPLASDQHSSTAWFPCPPLVWLPCSNLITNRCCPTALRLWQSLAVLFWWLKSRLCFSCCAARQLREGERCRPRSSGHPDAEPCPLTLGQYVDRCLGFHKFMANLLAGNWSAREDDPTKFCRIAFCINNLIQVSQFVFHIFCFYRIRPSTPSQASRGGRSVVTEGEHLSVCTPAIPPPLSIQNRKLPNVSPARSSLLCLNIIAHSRIESN